MNKLEFELKKEPPTAEELARARREATAQLEAVRGRERRWWFACALIGVAGFAVMAGFWWTGLIDKRDAILFAVACVGAIAVAASIGVGFAVMWVVALAIPGVVTGAWAGVGAIAVAGAFVFAVGKLWERRITAPRERIDAQLCHLIELEASSLPDECIAFAGWCDADETVGAYQRKLAAMSRKPVVGEYQAAQAWVEGTSARIAEQEKAERARLACDRLAVAV